MLRTGSRRRPGYGIHICAAILATFLLLLSLSVLHSRLSSSTRGLPRRLPADPNSSSILLDDADNDAFDGGSDDRIDVTDDVEEDDLSGDAVEDEEGEIEDGGRTLNTGGYFWDHLLQVKRRGFGKRKGLLLDLDLTTSGGVEEEGGGDVSKIAFSSDDSPVDEEIKVRLDSIRKVEDVLLVKGGSSSLRDGWAKWYEAKRRFLKQDKMFASGLELMNPMNHPMLQNPDVPGMVGLTRGDKLVRKAIWKDLEKEKVPFGEGSGGKRVEGRGLSSRAEEVKKGGTGKSGVRKEHVYADGERWGYYPGFEPKLSFSAFMDKFFIDGQCSIRVFMVWNSPAWSFGVRHQRGLESFLRHHEDACVVVFSEMMELDFFDDFVKDGFKVAVAMPNLDELLKDTPVRIFASFWNDWRKTRYYSIHYSELIRLAALYKYGGIYLDSDVIVLKSLTSVQNSIAVESKASGYPIFNGAVMAFGRHSRFIMECMMEFYSTYEETRLDWNGGQLLTRVFKRLSGGKNQDDINPKLNFEDPHVFFPIDSQNITRYFTAAVDDFEKKQQEILLKEILDHSKTFHFWNSITSALVPEVGSLVERVINHHCLYCLDVL